MFPDLVSKARRVAVIAKDPQDNPRRRRRGCRELRARSAGKRMLELGLNREVLEIRADTDQGLHSPTSVKSAHTRDGIVLVEERLVYVQGVRGRVEQILIGGGSEFFKLLAGHKRGRRGPVGDGVRTDGHEHEIGNGNQSRDQNSGGDHGLDQGEPLLSGKARPPGRSGVGQQSGRRVLCHDISLS